MLQFQSLNSKEEAAVHAFIDRKVGSDFPAGLQRAGHLLWTVVLSLFGKKRPEKFYH